MPPPPLVTAEDVVQRVVQIHLPAVDSPDEPRAPDPPPPPPIARASDLSRPWSGERVEALLRDHTLLLPEDELESVLGEGADLDLLRQALAESVVAQREDGPLGLRGLNLGRYGDLGIHIARGGGGRSSFRAVRSAVMPRYAPVRVDAVERVARVSPDTARRVRRANRGSLLACHARRLKMVPGLEGRLALKVVVAAGRVVEISVQDDGVGDAELAACVVRRVRRWRFGEQENGELVLPLVFVEPG